MPSAPKTHRPPGWQPKPERDNVRKQANDRRRLSSKERGYSNTGRWNRFSAAIKQERIFCELCLTVGIETAIISGGTTDHIIPVENDSDPLFYEPEAVWTLCRTCNGWKSVNFDGSYGSKKIVAADRSLDGVKQRRAAIVARFKAVNGSRGVHAMSVPGAP